MDNESSFGAKIPPAEEKVLLRCIVLGEYGGALFLASKEVVARGFLLALEQC